MEVFCWEHHFLSYLAPVEGAAEVIEKFPQAVFISSGHCHIHSDPQPPSSTTLILWFPMTRLCPSLGWSLSSSWAVWSCYTSCLFGFRSSPHVSISSSPPSGSAHSPVCTSDVLSHAACLTSPPPLLPLPDSGAHLPGSLPLHVSGLRPCSLWLHVTVTCSESVLTLLGACSGGEVEKWSFGWRSQVDSS